MVHRTFRHGKSTVAVSVERALHQLGHHSYRLDGDNVRHRLNGDWDSVPKTEMKTYVESVKSQP